MQSSALKAFSSTGGLAFVGFIETVLEIAFSRSQPAASK
jgi:hypothetical protein